MKRISVLLLILVMILLSSCSIQTKVPYIGENGNWWVGDEDLGVAAQVSVEDANSQTDNSETQENDSFIPGENLYCAYEVPFSMIIIDSFRENRFDGKTATITSLVVTKEKKMDINNADDYTEGGIFYKYSYVVSATGTVRSEYSGKMLYFGLKFPSANSIAYGGSSGWTTTIVESDGSFVINWIVYSNFNEQEIVPYCIMLG